MKKLLLMLAVICLSMPALAAEQKETTYDRVMRTGVLRCGYYVFPPATYRDPNTGVISGLSVDMMNEIGKRAGLKIEWTEEVTFGNWVPALQAKRFDASCTPQWPEVSLGRAVTFTSAMFYAGLSPLVRADDARFKDDVSRLNKPDVTFVVQDNNGIDGLTRAAFPLARLDSMSASIDGPTVLQEIATKKADAILLDRNAEIEYNKNNPVRLRLVDPAHPVKVQTFTFAVGLGEYALRDFLDNALHDLINDGTVDRELEHWAPGRFLRAAKPYEASK